MSGCVTNERRGVEGKKTKQRQTSEQTEKGLIGVAKQEQEQEGVQGPKNSRNYIHNNMRSQHKEHTKDGEIDVKNNAINQILGSRV